MSGTFWFGENNYFCRAGWAWRTVVLYLREEQSRFPQLEAVLGELVTDETEHFNFEDATEAQLEIIRSALKAVQGRLTVDGPVGWSDPAFFPGFVNVLEELIHALESEIERRKEG